MTGGAGFVTTDDVHQGDTFSPAGPFMIGIWEIEPRATAPATPPAPALDRGNLPAARQDMGFTEGWGVCADQLKALCEAG